MSRRETALLAQIGSDWVGPYWVERQLDPASTAFVPLGEAPDLVNVTHRNWTAVGNLDSPGEAVVDPRGLLTVRRDGWSLDWWIGAEDRWHLPSREASVRQRLVEASPVVETAMRVPGGDAVHRAYAVRRSSAEGGGELVVVEVENRSKVPVALALALRPYNPTGLSVVERIGMLDESGTAGRASASTSAGAVVTVDGEVALLLPKAPSAAAASTFQEGDSAQTVLAGDAPSGWPGPVICSDGLAQAAFLFPLAHSATLRLALPLTSAVRPRRGGLVRRRVPQPVTLPVALPAADDVARGWRSQTERGVRLELPDDRLAGAVDANRRFLLLLHRRARSLAGSATEHRIPFRERAAMLHALDYYGFHDDVAQVLATLPDDQRRDGFLGQGQEWDANGAALWALGQHWRLTRDRALVEAFVGPLALGAHWIERQRRRQGSRSYRDDFWGVAGLRAAAELFEGVDQPDAAADAQRDAGAFWADLERSLSLEAERLGTSAIPFGPGRPGDSGFPGAPEAAWPLDLLASDDERIGATLEALRSAPTSTAGRACSHPGGGAGLSPSLTLQVAEVELARGERRCLDRLAWLLDAASGTWTWPEAIHPRLPGGCAGDGHHGSTAAELLRFVRRLLVREVDDGLALTSVVPDGWLGQGWAVHDAPTAHGVLSYAVRWHGDRPALLWDLRRHESEDRDGAPDASLTLRAPGLDPAWATTEPRGEALLGPVAPAGPTAGTAPPADDLSFH